MCIPILFWCFSYPCVLRILQAKWALTELLQLQVGVEGNFVWFVLLLPRRHPPHPSCSNDRTIHQDRAVPWTSSTDSSDLPPHLRQPPLPQLPQRPTQWCWGLHVYDKEVVHLLHHLLLYIHVDPLGLFWSTEKHSNREFSNGTLLFNYSCILLKGMKQNIHLDLLFKILCMKTRPSALVTK